MVTKKYFGIIPAAQAGWKSSIDDRWFGGELKFGYKRESTILLSLDKCEEKFNEGGYTLKQSSRYQNDEFSSNSECNYSTGKTYIFSYQFMAGANKPNYVHRIALDGFPESSSGLDGSAKLFAEFGHGKEISAGVGMALGLNWNFTEIDLNNLPSLTAGLNVSGDIAVGYYPKSWYSYGVYGGFFMGMMF